MSIAAAPSPRRADAATSQSLRPAERAGVAGPAEPRSESGAAEGADAGVPEPHPALVSRVAMHALEVMDGTRSIARLSGWVSEEVAEHLLRMKALHAERRAVYTDARHPVPTPGRVVMGRPRHDVVEAAVVMHTTGRSFAVAIRMEYARRRWRATSITVL